MEGHGDPDLQGLVSCQMTGAQKEDGGSWAWWGGGASTGD